MEILVEDLLLDGVHVQGVREGLCQCQRNGKSGGKGTKTAHFGRSNTWIPEGKESGPDFGSRTFRIFWFSFVFPPKLKDVLPSLPDLSRLPQYFSAFAEPEGRPLLQRKWIKKIIYNFNCMYVDRGNNGHVFEILFLARSIFTPNDLEYKTKSKI